MEKLANNKDGEMMVWQIPGVIVHCENVMKARYTLFRKIHLYPPNFTHSFRDSQTT